MSKDNTGVNANGLAGAFEGLFQEDSNTGAKKDKKTVTQEEVKKRGYNLKVSTIKMLDDYQYKTRKPNGDKEELSAIVETAIREYLKDKL